MDINEKPKLTQGSSDLLVSLNPGQKEAVTTVKGPVLVIAGPGSGKTRVITHRIAYLIREVGVPPWSIMAVTFTNKAAREMLTRLERLVPSDSKGLTVGTFHAICSRILRREGQAIGLDSRFTVYDDEDQTTLVRRVLKALNIDDKQFAPRAVLSMISSAKSELRDPADFARDASSYFEEVVQRVYRAYDEALSDAHALDFDDLLMKTIQLFDAQPDVLEKLQNRYQHILVDEFQDTNLVQYQIVRRLALGHQNLCVVGDPDQLIYEWRKADIKNILSFERDFPKCRTVYVEQNYRSTGRILDAAQAVISQNVSRKDKRLFTENPAGDPITVYEAYDEEQEAEYVVREIVRLVARRDVNYRDCAVMFRMGAQSRKLEEAFIRRHVPYRVIGTRFFQRREIKDLVAFLRVLANPEDEVSLTRIINVPPRGIGDTTLTRLREWSRTERRTLFSTLRLLAEEGIDAGSPLTRPAIAKLTAFYGILDSLRERAEKLTLPELLDAILYSTGYLEAINADDSESEESIQRQENVRELRRVAAEYADFQPGAGLVSFLESSALSADADEHDPNADAVPLLTLHSSKGLEFPAIFIVGCEEGVLPSSRSLDDPKRLEEERRLFYVGLTRAMRKAYLIYTVRRNLFGSPSPNPPSRFLADIPPSLTTGHSLASTSARGPRKLEVSTASFGEPLSGAPKKARSANARFTPGDRVRHIKYGEGIVIRSTLTRDDEEVEINFPKIGLKRLSTAFAPLHKI